MTVPEDGGGRWRTSSASKEGQDCVEIDMDRPTPDVGIRDSKDPEGGELWLPRASFRGLVVKLQQRD
ncbi:DUF397 domain-containing protein [Amycolatopsis eburnea]|uniref:DUF397 domain-containing protein n=1 Tax=Amycolatopsis eburnea TaxID=2267691 RepID=A0A427TKE2_9PSEU|nr:DUF397 domain-containing protein [Amycolatopsis eburnea]RSD24411.1 DUF397 domain-containing protein [Amycolatopsis eburnea]